MYAGDRLKRHPDRAAFIMASTAEEEVKAVVQPMPGVAADDAFAQSLIAFCRQHLAPVKCPRSVDFTDALPRLPTGKLYKRALRDSYWKNEGSIRVV